MVKTFGIGSISYDVRMVETDAGIFWRANVTVASVATGMLAASGLARHPKRALGFALEKLAASLKEAAQEGDEFLGEVMKNAQRAVEGASNGNETEA